MSTAVVWRGMSALIHHSVHVSCRCCFQVVYVESEEGDDLVVLDPHWLGSSLVGSLLSRERLQQVRKTGVYSRDDLDLDRALASSSTDIGSSLSDALPLLEALELCVACDVDEDVEFEFPCFNFLDAPAAMWNAHSEDADGAGFAYGGVRLRPPAGSPPLLAHLFPRLQVQLRRDFVQNHNSADCDLDQWRFGAKYCSGAMEALVTLERHETCLELKCRAPPSQRSDLFFFFEDIYHIVMDALSEMAPGLALERHLLSPKHLQARMPSENVYAYPPKDVVRALLLGEQEVVGEGELCESMSRLVCFGADDVLTSAVLGVDLHVSQLNVFARRKLCAVLDPCDPMGRDWCLFAVSLGLTEALPTLDVDAPPQARPRSKTDRALEVWARRPDATIGLLVRKLLELGRDDAADAVLTYAPLFHIFQDDNSNVKTTGAPSPDVSAQLTNGCHDESNRVKT